MQEGLVNLKKYYNHVDYILTHDIYTSLLMQMDGGSELYKPDKLSDYLQKIKQSVKYTEWVFGHFHINMNFYCEKATCIYEQIVRII